MGKGGSSILSFLLGALAGAVVALLYAPKSGEELRAQIRSEAEARMEQLNDELEKTLAEVRETVEKTRAELMSYMEQMQETEDAVVEEPALEVEAVEPAEAVD